MGMTVVEIEAMLRSADSDEFEALSHSLAADERKGVRKALDTARRRLQAEAVENERLNGLYAFDRSYALSDDSIVVGLDEVGRGAVAGPMAVGAVVLRCNPKIALLNDSKKLAPEVRETIAAEIKRQAIAWSVYYIDAVDIDREGMASSIRKAFAGALGEIEQRGIIPDVVLIDGNPLGIDPRERTVVKGDSKSASIAAASIVAKATRDELMRNLSSTFPQYGFADNKGYGSPEHIASIRKYGLSSQHRTSFCKSFMQESLFD